jgi:hypothetical protein
MIPPSAWGEEYAEATGFRLGRIEEIDGEACQIVTFATPRTQGRELAWYSWWVGTETGLVRRMAMVSRNHYMTNDYADIDAPLTVEPPVEVQTP